MKLENLGKKKYRLILTLIFLIGGSFAFGGTYLYKYIICENSKLILSAPLTHSDWVLKEGIDCYSDGVHHMLDRCKEAGLSRIYWRVLDSGRSLYPSELRDPMGPPEADSIFNPLPEDAAMASPNPTVLQLMEERYHYDIYDSFGEAVQYGHEIGLEIYAWFSINEDDHGWGWPSNYTINHPEYRWVRRDGTVYRSQLSFAFPEVRAHKLAIIEEVVTNYEIDGILLDWIRTGDIRDNPQNDIDGVANYGYETPLVSGFQAEYSVNPHDISNNDSDWIRYRAEPQTIFMRSIRTLTNSIGDGLSVAVLIQHPWGYRGSDTYYADNLGGLLLDLETWADEDLIDYAVPAGYYRNDGNPTLTFNWIKENTANQVHIWYFGWIPQSIDSFHSQFEEAQSVGAKQILFWEADYLDNYNSTDPEQEEQHINLREEMCNHSRKSDL